MQFSWYKESKYNCQSQSGRGSELLIGIHCFFFGCLWVAFAIDYFVHTCQFLSINDGNMFWLDRTCTVLFYF